MDIINTVTANQVKSDIPEFKPEQGNTQMLITSLDYSSFTGRIAIGRLQRGSLKEGQQIKYPEDIDDLSLYQDEKIIQLILSNLLYNAVNYSPEGSTIELYVRQNEKTITVTVKDNGFGIPEEDQKHIFERYFRAHNVTNIQGTGIGLNIVKNHLENLGGSIYFESEENKGTTFVIAFPNRAQQ